MLVGLADPCCYISWLQQGDKGIDLESPPSDRGFRGFLPPISHIWWWGEGLVPSVCVYLYLYPLYNAELLSIHRWQEITEMLSFCQRINILLNYHIKAKRNNQDMTFLTLTNYFQYLLAWLVCGFALIWTPHIYQPDLKKSTGSISYILYLSSLIMERGAKKNQTLTCMEGRSYVLLIMINYISIQAYL